MYNKNEFNILSFDLGINLGVVFSKFMVEENILIVKDLQTIKIDKYNKAVLVDFDYCTNIVKNIISFEQILKDTFDFYPSIDLYAVEDIYLARRFISAYSSLLLYLSKLEEMISIRYNKLLYKVATKTAKASVYSANATKDDIINSVLNSPRIKFECNNSYITEHTADSIAVGFSISQKLRDILI